MTINLDGLMNKIVIHGVKYQMVPFNDGDAKAKTLEVSKKPTTPMGITEMKR